MLIYNGYVLVVIPLGVEWFGRIPAKSFILRGTQKPCGSMPGCPCPAPIWAGFSFPHLVTASRMHREHMGWSHMRVDHLGLCNPLYWNSVVCVIVYCESGPVSCLVSSMAHCIFVHCPYFVHAYGEYHSRDPCEPPLLLWGINFNSIMVNESHA